MKSLIGVLIAVILFAGCATTEPKVPTDKKNSFISEVNQTTVLSENNVSSVEDNSSDDANLIVNVFDDELYFEKDKVGKDKRQVVIKYLDANKREKRALSQIYKKYNQLWSKQQSKDFFKILEEDKYHSLCSDKKYWDNLQFEENQPERDVLQSILLLRYLNNLTHGCLSQSSNEPIHIKYILSLLPHNVIIPKLIASYEARCEPCHPQYKKRK